MFKRSLSILAMAAVSAVGVAHADTGRDYVALVGSSTVFPFASAVAEHFGKANAKFKTPKVESTGTGGGLKLFCSGVGVQYPDIANASRRIKSSELEACEASGVKDVVEVKVGYDGITIATKKGAPAFKLTRKDLYLALAKQVPDPRDPNTLVANPYKTTDCLAVASASTHDVQPAQRVPQPRQESVRRSTVQPIAQRHVQPRSKIPAQAKSWLRAATCTCCRD